MKQYPVPSRAGGNAPTKLTTGDGFFHLLPGRPLGTFPMDLKGARGGAFASCVLDGMIEEQVSFSLFLLLHSSGPTEVTVIGRRRQAGARIIELISDQAH